MAGLEKAVTIDARSQFHLVALLGIHLCVMAGHRIQKAPPINVFCISLLWRGDDVADLLGRYQPDARRHADGLMAAPDGTSFSCFIGFHCACANWLLGLQAADSMTWPSSASRPTDAIFVAASRVSPSRLLLTGGNCQRAERLRENWPGFSLFVPSKRGGRIQLLMERFLTSP